MSTRNEDLKSKLTAIQRQVDICLDEVRSRHEVGILSPGADGMQNVEHMLEIISGGVHDITKRLPEVLQSARTAHTDAVV